MIKNNEQLEIAKSAIKEHTEALAGLKEEGICSVVINEALETEIKSLKRQIEQYENGKD